MVHKCCGTILFFSPLNLGIQTEMYVSFQKIYNKMFNKNQYIDYPKTWFYLSRPPMLPQQLATWPGGLLCASLCLVQAWFMPWQAWLMLKSTVGKIKMSKILYSRVLDSRHWMKLEIPIHGVFFLKMFFLFIIWLVYVYTGT